MARICEAESPFSGQAKVDESYFGGRHAKGKRGWGAGGKTMARSFIKAKKWLIILKA